MPNKKTNEKNLVAALSNAPRFPLAHLPTPLQPLPRLSRHLGGRVHLWMKRDDCTGLATGGNKARKLEFLLGDALAHNADMVITPGALQSNHVRQTAAAAAIAGLRYEALYEHRVADADADYASSGNVLLTRLLGATRRDFPAATDMDMELTQAAAAAKSRGQNPYAIAGGGSSPVGALGYVNAMLELMRQARAENLRLDCLVHATGSCGTQAGLVAGAHALQNPLPVRGVCVSKPRAEQEENVHRLACETYTHLRENLNLRGAGDGEIPRELVHANGDYVGAGYGLPTDGMREAVSLTARLEGILLDPVYAGKGMAGLLDFVRRGEFAAGQNVVFLHTGGAAALFAYRAALVNENEFAAAE